MIRHIQTLITALIRQACQLPFKRAARCPVRPTRVDPRVIGLLGLLTVLALGATAGTANAAKPAPEMTAFDQAASGAWREVFFDAGNEDWRQRWFLDGEVGTVKNGPQGMKLTAGPEFMNDAHHVVLWTKDSFAGDLKIEYDYTRLDAEDRWVTILFIQATGSGHGPYHSDIARWNELRRVPAMSVYFDHMHTYHLSYAAFEGSQTTSYIRARRYMPNRSGLEGTDLKPDYFPAGLFRTGVPHRITVIKRPRELLVRIGNGEQTVYCHMTNPDLPDIAEGRVGLRHMFTRAARYRNFRISTPAR
jgi:hypothetical protein